MKIWAKVELKDEKNAEYLVRTFFKEFNPESRITIKNKQAEVEIFFDKELPLESVEAICHCKIVEFCYGKFAENVGQVEEKTTPETAETEAKRKKPLKKQKRKKFLKKQNLKQKRKKPLKKQNLKRKRKKPLKTQSLKQKRKKPLK